MKKIFGLLASLAIAGSAQAVVLTYDFTVTVYSTYRCLSDLGCISSGSLDMWDSSLTLGDIGHGRISFDTETPQAPAQNQQPAPARGTSILYRGADAMNDSFLRFGDAGSVFQQSAPSNSAPNIWVANDVGRSGNSSKYDSFTYQAYQTLTSNSNKSLYIDLYDRSGIALTGGGIPSSLGGFASGYFSYTYSLGDNYSYVDGSITLTPVAPVPEPETYAMLLAGLGMLAWRRKRAGARAA